MSHEIACGLKRKGGRGEAPGGDENSAKRLVNQYISLGVPKCH